MNLNRIETEAEDIRKNLAEKRRDYQNTVSLRDETKQRRETLERVVLEKNRSLLDFSVSMDGGRDERNTLAAELEKTEKEVKILTGEVTAQKEKIYQMDTTKMTVEEVKKKKSGDTFSLTTIL